MRSGPIQQPSFLTVDVTRVRSTDSTECATPAAFKPRTSSTSNDQAAAPPMISSMYSHVSTTHTATPPSPFLTQSSRGNSFISSYDQTASPFVVSHSQRTPDRREVQDWRTKDIQSSIFRSAPMHPLASSEPREEGDSSFQDFFCIRRTLAFDEDDAEC